MGRSSRPYLIGIDLGTSTTKVAGFAVDGELLGIVRSATPTTRLPHGGAEHDADDLWLTTARLIRELVTSLSAQHHPVAIAAASVGEAGVPVDMSGQAVRPVIAWFDARTRAQAEWWMNAIGLDAVHRVSGQSIDPHYGVNKLMWVRDNEPEAFARTARWLSMGDLIVHRLAGVFVTDRTLASRTMVYDQAADAWSSTLLAEAGLKSALFPPVVAAGTLVGGVTREAARATGLREGLPVVVGGHDRLCGAFAARGSTPSSVDSTGSAEALVVPLDTYVEQGAEEAGYVACYADVVPGRYVFSARVGYAGSLLDWFRSAIVGPPSSPEVSYAQLIEEIPRPLAFSGLLVFPSFGRVITPFWDPASAPGLIAGLTLSTDRGRLFQALLEGISYSLRASVDLVERLNGRTLPTLRVEGGATKNSIWMQLKSDILGRPIEVVRLREATAQGAALLAGVGAGVYPSHHAAASTPKTEIEDVYPDPARTATYRTVFDRAYMNLAPALSAVNRVLVEKSNQVGQNG